MDKDLEVVYADNITGLSIGPSVSKIFFGIDLPDADGVMITNPTIQLIVPTTLLFQLTQHLVNATNDQIARGAIIADLDEFKNNLLNSSIS